MRKWQGVVSSPCLSEIIRKTLIVLMALFLLTGSRPKYLKKEVNPKILAFIPIDYQVLAIDSALINGDEMLDYLIVLKRKTETDRSLRPLIYLASNDKGKMDLVYRNDSAIYTATDGPYSGSDCFGEITLNRDSICIQYYGGMSTRWSETHKFIYDSTQENFFLTSVRLSSDNIYDENPATVAYKKVYKEPEITIDKISIRKYAPPE